MSAKNSNPVTASSMLGVGRGRFAALDGCSKALVIQAVQRGRLPTLADGSLDPALAGSPWRQGNDRRDVPVPATARVVPATVSIDNRARAAEALVEQHGVFATRAEAGRAHDSYIARLRQIEFDLRSESVVEVDKVARQVGAEYAAIRTCLLSYPAEQAPQLFRCKSTPELQTALEAVVTRVLEALIGGPLEGPGLP